MTHYNDGEIVLVNFVHNNTNIEKKRPALVVLDVGDNDILLALLLQKFIQIVVIMKLMVGKMEVCYILLVLGLQSYLACQRCK